ncbi:uncharacterized protein LOC117595377 [Esox lucius]|uniref:uncharacterized protein LOC117595377 n=1 Tax=Esox lucius TaxID=8010 RepID=UPI001476B674|nr:uncharacterized protein LOC117595377 [Esox lucius]
MAWNSPRGQGSKPRAWYQRSYVPRKPLLQSNLSGENEAENKSLDLLSVNVERPSLLSGSSEALSSRERQRDVAERWPTDSYRGCEENKSGVDLTGSDVRVRTGSRGCGSLSSGHPCGPAVDWVDVGGWCGKGDRGPQQKVKGECVTFVPRCSGSTASLYPEVPAWLNKRPGEPDSVSSAEVVCPKQTGNVSGFQNLLESSRTSACLHRSMLDLEMGVSFVDRGLLPRGRNTFGDVALSPLDLEPPLYNKQPSLMSSMSCGVKMSCSVTQPHRGGGECWNGKAGSLTGLYSGNWGNQFSGPYPRTEIARNAGQQSPNLLSSGVSMVADVEPGLKDEWEADGKTDFLDFTPCGSDFLSDGCFLPASLSRRSFCGRQKTTGGFSSRL